ncbi:MAG TPA: DUF885 family protein [bacterium]|nr:DUF885 family protein [bacterium]
MNATFVGVHDWDDRLPDYSDAGLADTQSEMAALLRRLRAARAAAANGAVSPVEALDGDLAEGFLEIDLWEMESAHGPRGNPCAFTGEAVFGVIALLLRPFAPLAERVDRAIARMAAIPAFLAEARRLTRVPAAWVERAQRECAGARALFERGVELFLAEEDAARHGVDPERLRGAARQAAAAFAQFADHLEHELRPQGTDAYAYACGEAALELLMRRGHGVTVGVADARRLAEERAEASEAALRARAADAGFGGDWRAALAALAERHPTVDRYYARYAEIWDAARAAAVDHRLVTWPDYPIRFVPRPRWSREAAPDLYFLAYRAPAAYDRVPAVDYLVTPVDPEMPADEQAWRLRTANDVAITLNHVIHHAGLGHHVQNWFAYRAESRIGRIAAVDCASRIAMMCGGTMAEGWACYAVDLMEEIGFLSPLERCAQAHTRLRIALRAVADVALHTGQWTLRQTAEAYETRGGMDARAARAEAGKNAMFPATAMMYMLGVDAIHALRRRDAARRGAGFDLRAFHDRLLACGSVPVARMASLLGEEGTRTP